MVAHEVAETMEALAHPEVPVIEAFSETYAEARRRFLDLVAERGAQLESVPHPTERGADGEELAIDVATFGDPEAAKTFLVVSGTHGQEGFLGSALQLELLRDLEIPDGVNVVALHALNPWGFSHHSRTDENNIDLNRNFLDHDAQFLAQRSLSASCSRRCAPRTGPRRRATGAVSSTTWCASMDRSR